MIRPTTPNDTTALIALADATGLLGPSQLEDLSEMLSDYFSANSDSDRSWLVDDDNSVVGDTFYIHVYNFNFFSLINFKLILNYMGINVRSQKHVLKAIQAFSVCLVHLYRGKFSLI